jgi:hypothetical protein
LFYQTEERIKCVAQNKLSENSILDMTYAGKFPFHFQRNFPKVFPIKESFMIKQTISHYAPKAHPSPTAGWRTPLAEKILDKLGEVPNSPVSVSSPEGPKGIPLEDASPRAAASLSIPPYFGRSKRRLDL